MNINPLQKSFEAAGCIRVRIHMNINIIEGISTDTPISFEISESGSSPSKLGTQTEGNGKRPPFKPIPTRQKARLSKWEYHKQRSFL